MAIYCPILESHCIVMAVLLDALFETHVVFIFSLTQLHRKYLYMQIFSRVLFRCHFWMFSYQVKGTNSSWQIVPGNSKAGCSNFHIPIRRVQECFLLKPSIHRHYYLMETVDRKASSWCNLNFLDFFVPSSCICQHKMTPSLTHYLVSLGRKVFGVNFFFLMPVILMCSTLKNCI